MWSAEVCVRLAQAAILLHATSVIRCDDFVCPVRLTTPPVQIEHDSNRSPILRIELHFFEYSNRSTFKKNFNDYKNDLNNYLRDGTLKMDKNMNYAGSILLGRPINQRFDLVVFDTSFSALWVPSDLNCLKLIDYLLCDLKCGDGMDAIRCYHRNRSNTYQDDTIAGKSLIRNLDFGSDNHVSGLLSYETLMINDMEIPGTEFIEATSISKSLINNVVGRGVMGLGFPSAKLQMAAPFFTMIDRGTISAPMFSLHLGSKGGVLDFGGTSEDLYEPGTLKYEDLLVPTPIHMDPIWSISIESIQMRKNELCIYGCEAIIDTGSTLISAPKRAIERICQLNNITYTDELLEVPCFGYTGHPKLVLKITIGGMQRNLRPENYVIKLKDGICVLGFMGNESKELWVLGNLFLSTVYTVFDVGEMRIGFATRKNKSYEGARYLSHD